MKKRYVLILLLVLSISLILCILSVPIISAVSVDSEMKKITHYAEEYETGNIDYVKLMLYLSSARESLNEVLGATGKEIGGVVKQEQIRKVLGEPNEETKWVWVEGEEQDRKLDYYVPVWKKIVFDGKKIQIRMEAFPSVFKKNQFDDFENENIDELPEEGSIIYRLHFSTEFKKPEEQIDIQGKINIIQTSAETFNSNPTSSNAEELAKQSVNAEMIFQNYFRQGSGKCEDIMKSIFGSENQRESQQVLLNEIVFCEGEKFEAILRLEMCDDCEWNYINMDLRFEGRGNFKPPKQGGNEGDSKEKYKNMDSSSLMSETTSLIESMKQSCAEEDLDSMFSYTNKLRTMTEAWNEKANDVWEQVEIKRPGKIVEKSSNQENEFSKEDNQGNVVVENTEGDSDTNANNVVDNDVAPGPQGIVGDRGGDDVIDNTITGNFITGYVIEENNQQSEESKDPYYWIKQDQLQRQKANELRKQNYEARKSFYLGLFSGYEKREFYFSQTSFEKRLVQEFKEKGEEICNNNIDDNENEQVDCDDSQCGGQVCGKGTASNGNETIETDLYCISGICQAKEYKIETKEGFCGDGFCDFDLNETTETCFEDCVGCPVFEAIECSGKVIFKGKDEKGCYLEPVCVEGQKSCNINEDCEQPLCGIAECVKEGDESGKCEVIQLKECQEAQCEEGEKQITKCNDEQELVNGICEDGIWISIDISCSAGEKGNEIVEEEIVNNECETAGDCGGDKVCSNGECIKLPEKKEVVKEITEGELGTAKLEIKKEIIGGGVEEKEEPSEKSEPKTNSEPEVSSEPEEPVVEPEEPLVEEPPEESIEKPVVEPEPEAESQEEQSSEPEVTGNVIFNFIVGLFSNMRITGEVVDEGGEIVDTGGDDVGGEPPSNGGNDVIMDDTGNYDPDSSDTGINDVPIDGGGDELGPGPESNNDCADKYKACGGSCPPCDYDQKASDGSFNDGNFNDNSEEFEERDNQERERNEKENKERCKIECARPCVDKCIREACGESMDCNIDKESKSCESGCSADDNCISKCMEGGDWWKEFENEDMNKQEKGVFQVGGGCRTEKGRTEGYIWFGGWGEPFEQVEPLKQKYYEGGQADWCEYEIENLIRQRQEFEKGFNQEFAVWFFEKYLPNSAEEWEQSVSGIFELYWSNVDNQMMLAHTMKCLEKNDITELMNINLINIEYETDYGKLKYWEEIKEVKMPGMDEKVVVVSPYMSVWVFPPKEFMAYEMKTAMENHEFPGTPEEKLERNNQEGLTEIEKQEIRQDKKMINNIKKLQEKYNGNLDFVIQFKDYETNEVVFNMYAQINEKDIMKVEPMPVSENPAEDARVELDFKIMYEMIYDMEKDMGGEMIESPPWDRKLKPIQKVKEVVSGAKMYLKMRKLMKSAKYYPEDAEKDVKEMFKFFFEGMMGGDDRGPKDMGDENSEKESPKFSAANEGISGKAIWISD